MISSAHVFILLFGITLGLSAQGQVTTGGRGREILQNLLQQVKSRNVVEEKTSEQVNPEGTKLRIRKETPSRSKALAVIQPCGPIIGFCRLTYSGSGAQMHAIASCFCRHGEDVSDNVTMLASLTCPLTTYWDNKTYDVVARSTLFISGCSIRSGVFPSELLERLRQTKNFIFTLDSVPYARLPTGSRVRTVSSVQGNISNSIITGLHEGWFSNAKDVQFNSLNSDLGIIGKKAFAGYGDSAKAQIHIVNSNITNIVQNAFDLPKSGEVLLSGVRLQSIKPYAFSGGSLVNIEESVIMNVNKYAFNLHGIDELALSYSTYGNVEQDVLYNQPPIEIRTGGIPDDLRDTNVSIRHNHFMRLQGRAFQWLCDTGSLDWTNNTVINIADPPLRLKDDNCTTDRDWDAVFSINNLNCMNCSDFDNYADDQVCALYKTSHCYSCEVIDDACDKLLIPYISKKCKAEGDNSLQVKCMSTIRRSPRTGSNGSVNTKAPLAFIIASAIMLLYIAAEEHRLE